MSDEKDEAVGAGGEANDAELRQILGDEYDAVAGKSQDDGPPPEVAGGLSPEAAEGMLVGQTAGGSPSGTVGMTPAEAADWERQMAQELEREKASAARPEETGTVQPVHFSQLEDIGSPREGSIDMLLDVKLPISVELGRTEMLVKEILEYGPGTVIELNKLAGEPVDVFINGRLIAQGEVVVVDEHFGVRVTNLLSPRDRVKSLA